MYAWLFLIGSFKISAWYTWFNKFVYRNFQQKSMSYAVKVIEIWKSQGTIQGSAEHVRLNGFHLSTFSLYQSHEN